MINFAEPGKASFIYGGQFGSEGKGQAAAWVAKHYKFDLAVTNASANAGHTVVREDGRKMVTRHLPMYAAITNCYAHLSAGAIIDPDVLEQEIKDTGYNGLRLSIHQRAAVIYKGDAEEERANMTNGSTAKGVGEALAHKIRRYYHNRLAMHNGQLKPFTAGSRDLNRALEAGLRILVEVPQGFSLSINHGLDYPYCTSRDCTVMAAISDAGIHPRYVGPIMGVYRTYPIRVGGNSGPCYEDQKELTWKDVDVEPEYTTVTGRMRRVFTWSNKQFCESIWMNRPDIIFLTHLDYPNATQTAKLIEDIIRIYNYVMNKDPIIIGSHGPTVADISVLRGD